MRFSKAPLIATLMAVALSLLVILPALAENTDGQSYQGRTTSTELIVGVFENVAGSGATSPLSLTAPATKASLSPSYMLGEGSTPAADPKDTFFNGRLYVSNQDDAFNTVLVTHLAPDSTTLACVSVTIRNENTGDDITLQLVPTKNTGDPTSTRYYQNYFKVVDRDADTVLDNKPGPYTCTTDVVAVTDGVSVADADLAQITASDGDRLTINSGTRSQDIYVDGVAPTFSDISPANGARFRSATLRIGFEVRDSGSGLRHDGENVTSKDGDAVLHDAANADNTDPAVIGDNDGITDREPISMGDGGSEDITVTFKQGAFDTVNAKQQAQDEADTAEAKVTAAIMAATNAGTVATDAVGTRKKASVAGTGALGAADVADEAVTPARDDVPKDAIVAGALGDAADDLETAADALDDAADMLTAAKTTTSADLVTAAAAATKAANYTDPSDATKKEGATVDAAAAKAVADAARGMSGRDQVAVAALDAAADALDTAADALMAAADALTAASGITGLKDAAKTAQDKADDTPSGESGTQIDDHGSSGWVQVVRGVAYEANIVYNITDHGTSVKSYEWKATAKDRVGNEGNANKKPFALTIDNDAPKLSEEARTGISYDLSKNAEVRDRSSIALTFINGMSTGEDPITASSLDIRDFNVEGFEVMDFIQPELIDKDDPEATDVGGGNIGKDLRSRVYLKLDKALGSAAEPRIQILGGAVTDLAGNPNTPPQSITAKDNIPAGLTITITSSDSSSGRPVANEKGTFTITVDSDEPLKNTPRLYFTSFEVTGKATNNTGGIKDEAVLGTLTLGDLDVSPVDSPNSASALDVVERGLSWTQDYKAKGLTGANNRAVLVWSEDANSNAGSSTGWTDGGSNATRPDPGDTLSLAKLDAAGLLIEIDRGLAKPDATSLPAVGTGKDALATESTNPYLQLMFSESAENTANLTFAEQAAVVAIPLTTPPVVAVEAITAVNATFTGVKAGSDTTKLDAHKTVTLTAVTVDGEDVSGSVGPGLSTSEDRFVIALRGLESGMHTLMYSAVDEAGNELTDEKIEFEVRARAAYKIDIRPGWNLISLPGTPLDNSIGSVIGTDLDAAIVLGYQNGAWVSAIRNDAGEWQGTMSEIVGGYGYWVQTTAFETISTTIPSADPTDVLPSVPVIAGWNLLGVVDIAQGKAGEPPIGKEEADDYFVSIAWRVGYYFNNETNSWQKIVPDTVADGGEEILNGKGYWIWSTGPGKLVP